MKDPDDMTLEELIDAAENGPSPFDSLPVIATHYCVTPERYARLCAWERAAAEYRFAYQAHLLAQRLKRRGRITRMQAWERSERLHDAKVELFALAHSA